MFPWSKNAKRLLKGEGSVGADKNISKFTGRQAAPNTGKLRGRSQKEEGGFVESGKYSVVWEKNRKTGGRKEENLDWKRKTLQLTPLTNGEKKIKSQHMLRAREKKKWKSWAKTNTTGAGINREGL